MSAAARRRRTTPRELAPTWRAALDAWSAAMRADGRAESTIAARCKYVRAFARDVEADDPWSVVHDDLATFVAAHAGTSASAYSHRSALRTFYAWAEGAGHVAQSPALYLDGANGGRPVARRQARPVGAHGPLPLWTPGVWEGPLAAWRVEQRARGLSTRTLRTWDYHLRNLSRTVPHRDPFTLTRSDLTEFMADRARWSNETRRGCRSAFRSFYGWAAEAGHVTEDPAAKLPKIATTAPLPHPASETAVHFAVLTATPRERLMVRLAAEIGLRCAEVSQVHSRDLVRHDDGWSLVVLGKGARRRVMPLPDELAAELRGLPDGWAFPSPSGAHLTPDYVSKLVRRLLPPGVTMHALRHRFATRTYAMSRDVFVVQSLLGHSKPETTRRYVEVGDDRLRAAVVDLARATTRSPRPAGARWN
ncbi:tyrosine-type recombinase/integrase [Xylanimonas protaetiae]|uniref:Integrase n=1 Tax=Xylanimonas protaetiae TaxID=2509457 RepID=A0A4P6F556_9MICO|nr:tyrosine-type recombinase/integrase [Xylanimonas protaetiae]QAY70486.1 hypothetical protein ET471_10965 [Xylanimonas protaetiae]